MCPARMRRLCPVQDEVGPFLCQLAPAINVQRTAMGTLDLVLQSVYR